MKCPFAGPVDGEVYRLAIIHEYYPIGVIVQGHTLKINIIFFKK